MQVKACGRSAFLPLSCLSCKDRHTHTYIHPYMHRLVGLAREGCVRWNRGFLTMLGRSFHRASVSSQSSFSLRAVLPQVACMQLNSKWESLFPISPTLWFQLSSFPFISLLRCRISLYGGIFCHFYLLRESKKYLIVMLASCIRMVLHWGNCFLSFLHRVWLFSAAESW